MTHAEKEKHVNKYDRELVSKKDTSNFDKHIQHFLEYESQDDEAIAEVLDFMYAILLKQ